MYAISLHNLRLLGTAILLFFSFSNFSTDYYEEEVHYYNNGSINVKDIYHFNANRVTKTIQDKYRRNGTKKWRIVRNPNYITFMSHHDKKGKTIKEQHFYYDCNNRLIKKIVYKNGQKYEEDYIYEEDLFFNCDSI